MVRTFSLFFLLFVLLAGCTDRCSPAPGIGYSIDNQTDHTVDLAVVILKDGSEVASEHHAVAAGGYLGPFRIDLDAGSYDIRVTDGGGQTGDGHVSSRCGFGGVELIVTDDEIIVGQVVL